MSRILQSSVVNFLKDLSVADVKSNQKKKVSKQKDLREKQCKNTEKSITLSNISDVETSIYKSLKDVAVHKKKDCTLDNASVPENTIPLGKRSFELNQIGSNLAEISELNYLRNNQSMLLGADVIFAWLVKAKMIPADYDIRLGEHMIRKYGGLQSSQMSNDDLSFLCSNNKTFALKNNGKIAASYLYTSNLNSKGCSRDEKILLGENTHNWLTKSLRSTNMEEWLAKCVALSCLDQNKLAYGSNIFADRMLRRMGLGSLVRLVTFAELVEQGKEQLLYRIFSINSIYNNEELVYKFSPSITNATNIAISQSDFSKSLGIAPMKKKITEMVDGFMTPNATKSKVARVLGISEDETEEYNIQIDNLVFMMDIEKAILHLVKKVQKNELFHPILNELLERYSFLRSLL